MATLSAREAARYRIRAAGGWAVGLGIVGVLFTFLGLTYEPASLPNDTFVGRGDSPDVRVFLLIGLGCLAVAGLFAQVALVAMAVRLGLTAYGVPSVEETTEET